jgi:PEP-CTERM putative exosortase interaction domain
MNSPRRSLLLLSSFFCAATAGAAEVTWNADSGDFLIGSNWSTGTFPPAADNASISNGGTATMSGGTATVNQLWTGNGGTDTNTGTFVQTGGTLTLTTGGVSGRGPNGTGTWTMTGGTLTTGEVRVGGGNGTASVPQTSTGTMTVSNPGTTVTSSGYVGVGSTGNGTLTISNSASWTHNGSAVFLVGGDNNNAATNQAGGTGVLNVNSGATLTFGGAANLSIGRNTSTTVVTGSGTLNVNGGTITLGGGSLNFASKQGGAGQLAGNGTLNMNSGSITSPNGIRLNEGTTTLNFNGGTTTVSGFLKQVAGGTGTINFNGGTIRASAASGDFFGFTGTGSGGVLNLNVLAGGLVFDTNGNDVTITQSLSGSGGLTKLGGGTLTFSSLSGVGYTGDTTVSAGVLSLAAASLDDASDLWLTSGSVLDLNFIGTDAIARLYINGVLQSGGTWGAIGSGAMFTSSLFTGDGLLLVAVPEPVTVGLIVSGFLGAVAIARRRRRAA